MGYSKSLREKMRYEKTHRKENIQALGGALRTLVGGGSPVTPLKSKKKGR